MQKSTMLAAIFVNHRRAKTLDEALQILREFLGVRSLV